MSCDVFLVPILALLVLSLLDIFRGFVVDVVISGSMVQQLVTDHVSVLVHQGGCRFMED